MGYPQFNKTTIQLPVPASTMTKAEYKALYGIDLDAIDFPKVTLLVDGVNKYPVDEIKIVSDDVLIFAGGKILTIGDDGNIAVTANAYSVDNAKPIYWHGLELQQTASKGIVYAHILNNSPTQFTLDSFISWITSQTSVVVQCEGVLTIDNVVYNILSFYKEAGSNNLNLAYTTESGFAVKLNVDLTTIIDRWLRDSVNKIN